jgi:hypothetical protein
MELRDEDFDDVNPGETLPLLEEGWWPARWQSRESKMYGWGEKLIVRWQVYTSLDKARSATIPRFYNAQRDRANRFCFGPLHDYRKDWIAANGGRVPLVRSKLPLSIWQGRIFLVEVVTVRQDSKGRPLTSSLLWSKIGRVIRPMAELERWERLPIQPLNFLK